MTRSAQNVFVAEPPRYKDGKEICEALRQADTYLTSEFPNDACTAPYHIIVRPMK